MLGNQLPEWVCVPAWTTSPFSPGKLVGGAKGYLHAIVALQLLFVT